MSKRKTNKTSAGNKSYMDRNTQQVPVKAKQTHSINNEEGKSDPKIFEKQRFLWEWGMHEDHISLNRSNFFFVGESMMIAGYATLKSSSLQEAQAKLIPICLLGLVISLLWLIVNVLHIRQTAKPIREELRRIELQTWLGIEDRRYRKIRISSIIG